MRTGRGINGFPHSKYMHNFMGAEGERKGDIERLRGISPEERPLNEILHCGFVVIDKPAGPTSHEVVSWVKDILGVRKASHTGTLDPKVTGVLPVLLGSATKLMDFFVGGEKEYVCVMHIHDDFNEEDLKRVCEEFTGEIYQRPPLKSAVRRRIRVRKVHYIRVNEIEGRDVLLTIGCEAGTYIRMLCHHIGLALGVGAHMLQLRRTKAFPFTEEDCVRLHDLKDAFVFWEENGEASLLREFVRPIEDALFRMNLPFVVVKDTAVDAICHGASLYAPGVLRVSEGLEKGAHSILLTQRGEIIAVGTAEMSREEMLNASEGVCVRVHKVLLKRKTYPSVWKRRKQKKEEAEGSSSEG
ncbi:MAG: RNA-guided pseudouridylation complex pseudouridine synthase subunit Cbf5 [Candidatus Methanospirare jalkutatii]|nr:RNA-guided pseudouridylation complex pseudouridine synthase subunit Cbf5 [Candidatus Methanospirare jalkutatii]